MFSVDTMEDIRRVADKNFYDSVHDAVTLAEQLGSILKKGSFRLTKWIRICLQVIESISLVKRADAVKSIDFGKLPIELNIPERTVTRWSILSGIASLYDPIGLLASVILPAKHLLQRLYKSGLGWDVEIPEDEKTCWFEFLKDIDASEVGYGVVAYSRCYVAGEGACCRLILAKARVTLLKVQTKPRLELKAPVLAARISSQLQTESDRDSQFKTFVANRVSTIHSLTKTGKDYLKLWRGYLGTSVTY
ncbi:Gag-Pol polyprotein [Schistosoma japonicum]|uniref:Gag-Pol polyprotein n=1 Tax=Schistosoma japonicum TaxID=6182 RepID=A0A4Z2D7P8_SCHJA|nr:Gag-Pol polyprotein [Schistosoma japonicum]